MNTTEGEVAGNVFYNIAFGKNPYYKHQGWLSGRVTCVLVAVPIFIYFGIQKDKYDIDKYNKTNSEENKERDNKIRKICGVIMLIAFGYRNHI